MERTLSVKGLVGAIANRGDYRGREAAASKTAMEIGFVALADLSVLPADLARHLTPSAGLRNRLVREYDRIDDEKVFESIGRLIELYPAFVAAIEGFLERSGL